MASSFYFIHGNSQLLVNEERLRLIKKINKQNQYIRQRTTIDPRFNWDRLIADSQAMDLWSNHKIIDIDNHANHLDRKATAALIELSELASEQQVVIVCCDKLTSAQAKAKWYKQLEKNGQCIAVRAPFPADLPQWLSKRAQSLKLQLTPRAAQLLAELTQGHLLAGQQALEKCVLLEYQKVDVEQVQQVIANSAKYSVFDLGDALLQGGTKRCLQILQGLQQQNTEATLVLWSASQACRQLLQMKHKMQQGASVNDVTRSQWANKRPLYQTALKRLPYQQLNHMMQQCHTIDQSIKGYQSSDSWQLLSQLCLQFCKEQYA